MFNYTSTIGYDLLIKQENILKEKFKDVYSYLHPECFDY